MANMEDKDLREKENKAFQEMRRSGKNIEESRQKDDDQVAPRGNKLWVWLGTLVLIFIILYWLFAIGTFGDLANWFNG
ncbi:MAG: hypothetical protein K2I08_00355 [Muribaculaceae bacterium]|nr:hypothetical protein [Muribaculaceae bacterium]MDE6521652.1 hypothetical protein [Muribaculaceae bacterium]